MFEGSAGRPSRQRRWNSETCLPVLSHKSGSPNALRAVIPLLLAICTVFTFSLVHTQQAHAADEPFVVNFDSSAVRIGLLPALPLDSAAQGASIRGTIDEAGAVKIPADQFNMPVVDVGTALQSLAGLDVPVTIQGFMGVEEDATGTFDRETGRLEIETRTGIWLSVNVQELVAALGAFGLDFGTLTGGLPINLGTLGNLTCGFSPMDVTFTTESTGIATGQRFADGPSGPGALAGQWSQLGPLNGRGLIPIFGPISLPASIICRALPPLIGDALSSAIGGTVPGLGGLDLGSLAENLDTLNFGPSSLTLRKTKADPQPGPEPERGRASLRIRVTPQAARIRANRSVRYRITVRNAGSATARRTRLCAIVPRSAIRGARCKPLVRMRPGQVKRRQFRLSLRRSAGRRSYPVRFTVRSAGSRGATTRVRLINRAR
jgi:hypothetical protein